MAGGVRVSPAGALTPFGASGVWDDAKIMSVQVTTDANGAWSADFTRAKFTAPPQVSAQAISAGTALNQSANATVTARSATAGSGFVDVPNPGSLGGPPNQRAGAGIVVSIIAIGP